MAETVPVNASFHEIKCSSHYQKWLDAKSTRYKIYREKWVHNPAGYIDEGYPLNLDIEASSACNLHCPMCPRSLTLNDGNKKVNRLTAHFDFDLYKRIIDEAADLGVFAVKLYWLGEPLMNPRIVDMVRYAKDRNIEDVILLTNAVLLDENMSRNLINAGVDKLFFSFDSPFKETYEKIRIGACYEKVLANIKRFNEIRDEMNSLNPTTRVQMVVLPGNEDTLEAFANLFGNIVDVVAYEDLFDHEKDYSQLRQRSDIDFSCASLWQRMLINSDGMISICCMDHNANCDIGNIKETTIKKAWNSPQYKKLRKLHRNKEWHKIEICSTCPMVTFSKSGTLNA